MNTEGKGSAKCKLTEVQSLPSEVQSDDVPENTGLCILPPTLVCGVYCGFFVCFIFLFVLFLNIASYLWSLCKNRTREITSVLI